MTLFDDHGEQNQIRWKIMYKPGRLKEENNMSKIYELTPTEQQNQEVFTERQRS